MTVLYPPLSRFTSAGKTRVTGACDPVVDSDRNSDLPASSDDADLGEAMNPIGSTMRHDDLDEALERVVASKLDLLAAVEILKEYRIAGCTSADVQSKLGMLSDKYPNHWENIAEIMDIVAGWCRPELRVWADASGPTTVPDPHA